jgi:hypothetical protein
MDKTVIFVQSEPQNALPAWRGGRCGQLSALGQTDVESFVTRKKHRLDALVLAAFDDDAPVSPVEGDFVSGDGIAAAGEARVLAG